ncbi:MAG: nucleoside triphosphate pyrophosphohydrolase, partial [Eubacteriales bacterium]
IVTEIDNPLLASEVKLFLSEVYDDETQVVWVCGSRHKQLLLCELDREADFGTGVSVVLPPLKGTARIRYTFGDLLQIMERLRGRDGCPWDLEQTHETLRQFVLEEAYEVVDAVDKKDPAALADELGDLLLQVVFHAQIGKQRGEFDIMDVTSNICNKMISRHPHIFSNTLVRSSDDVLTNWEAIKRKEKSIENHTQAMEDIPAGMSALMRAYKIQKKAAQTGFDWKNAADAFEKIKEELGEFEDEMNSGNTADMEKEAGDILFAVVNVLRQLKINPEVALGRTSQKFINRFRYVEQKAGDDLGSLSLAQLDVFWDEAKSLGL